MEEKKYRDSARTKKRGKTVLVIIIMAFIFLFFVLCYRMIFKSKDYKSRAQDQWSNEVKIAAKRGNILDRNGNELAVSIDVYRVDLDLNSLKKYSKKENITIDEMANKISTILGIDLAEVSEKLNKEVQSVTLARRIDKDVADKIKELEYNGIIVSPDTKRYYINGDFLSHVMGVTNIDGEGQIGVELEYNDVLEGVAGLRISEVDANQNDLPYVISDFTQPIEGKDVLLTIDEKVQYFAEKAATEALNDNLAKAVTIMVMDPNNGEILALANKGSFDLNNPRKNSNGEDIEGEALQALWKNRAVSESYEPGSIFKVFTMSSAIEENLVSENETFECNGANIVSGERIRCWKTDGHGTLNLSGILENSCNVGFMKLGERLGAEKLYDHIEKFGFTKKSGVDLPGEATGIILGKDVMTALNVAAISFGQTNSMTVMQYMKAFNSVVNGGTLIDPHVMKEVSYVNEKNQRIIDKTYDQYYPETVKKKSIEKETSKKMLGYLESVISNGGGKQAFIEGYRIGGKTGTAQKVRGRSYEEGLYISSFAGVAPADNPRFTVFVSIDEPRGEQYYAGQIAAPVGKKMFNDLFNYYSIEVDASQEDINESLKKDIVVPNVVGMSKEEAINLIQKNLLNYKFEGEGGNIIDMSPKPGQVIKEGKEIILYTSNSTNYNKEIIVPDLRGYSKERAYDLLTNLGLQVTFSGNGLINSQSIEPNKKVLKGTSIILELNNVIGD